MRKETEERQPPIPDKTNKQNLKLKPPRVPRRAAVTITVAPGRCTKYADVMKVARTEELKQLGIKDIRCWWLLSGGMVIEIPGKESSVNAEELAEDLKKVFNCREYVRVARLIKRTELRIRELDYSVVPQYVALAIAAAGDCKEEDVSIEAIRLQYH